MDFKDLISEKFNGVYISPSALTHEYAEVLSNIIETYSKYLSDDKIAFLKRRIKEKDTTISSFLHDFSDIVNQYHRVIRPEDFDYSLPYTPYENLDEDKQMFLSYYSNVYDTIAGDINFNTKQRLLFDFSTIENIHLSKKKIRSILTDTIGREVKSWEIDNLKTLADLKSFYEREVSGENNEISTSYSITAITSKISTESIQKITGSEQNGIEENNNFSQHHESSKEADHALKIKEAQVAKSRRLNEFDLQYFANNLRFNREFFKEEEDKVKKENNEAKNKENETINHINSLGSKPWAGKEPDAKSYFIEPVKTCGSIWLVCLIILFIFHCAFWLIKVIFDIPWDTWGWTKTCFWWGLIVIGIVFGVSLIAYIIKYSIWNNIHKKAVEWDKWKKFYEKQKADYKQKQSECSKTLDDIRIKRINILEYAIRKNLNLPIKEITDNVYNTLRNKYFQLYSIHNKIGNITDVNEKLQTSLNYADQKLDVFFQWSIPSESTSNAVLNNFLNSYNKKLKNYRENVDNPYLREASIKAITKENDGFSQHLLDADIEEFTDILNWDTSGLFTKHSSSKLEEQVNALERTYHDAVSIYESYSKVCSKINQILGLSRLVAYKNLYLGVELLNIIRENAGGGTLSTIEDKVDPMNFNKNSNIDIKVFSSSQAFKDILNTGFESILTSIGNGIQDKSTRKFMAQNPKSAAMAVAGMAVFQAGQALVDAWKQRNAKIESLLKKQNYIIKEMEKIPGIYLEKLAASARALEISEAIINTNKGFMAIYQSLANKVFIQKDINLVTLADCQKLVLAIKEYKNISTSKL